MTTVAQALLVAPILRQEIFWNKVVLSQTLAAGGVGDASGEQGEAKRASGVHRAGNAAVRDRSEAPKHRSGGGGTRYEAPLVVGGWW